MPGETTAAVVEKMPSAFTKLLGQIGNGAVEDELSEMLVELTERLRKLGESGSGKPAGAISLTIKFKLDRGTFDIDAVVKMTEPRTIHARTLMYPVVGGGLSRQDPQQTNAFDDEVRDADIVTRPPVRSISSAPSSTARG